MQVAVAKTPKKKKSKILWVLLILFLVFIIGPIALFYGLFYDTSTKKVVLQDDVSLANIGNRIIVDSLDYAPEEAKIDVKLTENDLDNILHVAMDQITKKVKYVKKAYMYVRGNAYNFFVDVDGYIIKSRVKVSTTMEISEDGEYFVFQVKDIAVGRLDGILKPAKAIINRFITTQKINEVLSATGMNLTFDQDKYAIVYPKSSLLADLGKLTNNEQTGLYFDVMQTMVHDNMMQFEFENNNVIEGIVDLSRLATNEYVTDDSEHIIINSEDVQAKRDKLVDLIEHGDIDPTQKELPFYAWDFLFNGWEPLSQEAKSALADIDFGYIEIDDKETYKGFDLYDAEAKLVDKMKATVNPHKLIDKTENPRYTMVCQLSEADINEYIASRNIVGYTSLLHRDSPDGYKVNYITIENFYMNFYHTSDDKNIAEMVCKIDVNGYLTSLTFETEMPDGDEGFVDNKLIFKINEIKYGESDAENLKEEFFDIIYDALNNEADQSLQADKENYTIAVDFSVLMDYARQEAEDALETATGTYYNLETEFSMENLRFEISGENREETGIMALFLRNPINY